MSVEMHAKQQFPEEVQHLEIIQPPIYSTTWKDITQQYMPRNILLEQKEESESWKQQLKSSPRQQSQPTRNQMLPWSNNHKARIKFHKLVAQIIAVVEDSGFRELIPKALPRYQMPGRLICYQISNVT